MATTTEQAFDAFYETRAAAVLAYCSRLCPPERIAASVDAAFTRVREQPASTEGAAALRDARLRVAVRRAVAEHVVGGNGDYCVIVPRLLAARAGGALKAAEDDTLSDHLARCAGCRKLASRFDDAERALDALLPATDDAAPRPAAPLEEAAGEPPPGAVALAPPAGEPLESVPASGVRSPPAGRPASASDRGSPSAVESSSPSNLGSPPAVEPLAASAAAELSPDSAMHPPLTARAPGLVNRIPRPRLSSGVRRHVSAVLLVVGLLMIAEAVTTVVWKEPFTAYLASRAQAALRSELDKLAPGRLDAAERRSVAALANARLRTERRIALLAHDLGARVHDGQALGWIVIPKIGVDYVFVQGTDAASLRKGPAHYLQTPLPGEPGTVGIAAHRTTYLAPFRDIDSLGRGDRIVVRMPYGRFTYSVERHTIVPAGYRHAFRALGYDRLVLSACHPLYSASHRILVSARLVRVQPLGAARGPASSARPDQAAAQLAALGARRLTLGMSGPDVRELQRLLGVPPTGYFGYQTQSAVNGFASLHGLGQSGSVDEAFKRQLASRGGPPATPPTPPAVAPQPAPSTGSTNGQSPGPTRGPSTGSTTGR